jgi:hypothetical protein
MNNLFKRKAVDWIIGSKRLKSDSSILNNITNHNNSNNNVGKTIKQRLPKKPIGGGINNHHLDKKRKTKETIPKRVREMVWHSHNGETFNSKCYVSWCNNNVNVFNFQVGHDIPESKGGTLHLNNLKPICGNCNQSMGNKYTIQEWNKLVKEKDKNKICDSSQPIIVEDSNDSTNSINTTTKTSTNSLKQNLSIAILIIATIHVLTLL